ncbi:hypothetical protein ACQ1Q5_00245 [Ornithobacterium rhinotracheale]
MNQEEINQDERKEELETISENCDIDLDALKEIFGEDGLINMIDL